MSLKSPRLVVAGLVKKGKKYLLIKEKLESGRDIWIVPGGGVDFGESLEQAVLREIKEELGIDSKIIKQLGINEAIFPNYNYHTVIFFFLLKPLSDAFKLEEKIIKAEFFTLDEIKNLDLVESARWLFEENSKFKI